MSEYQEFTGKSVEEALRTARESFGVGLDDLDFEILTPGSDNGRVTPRKVETGLPPRSAEASSRRRSSFSRLT